MGERGVVNVYTDGSSDPSGWGGWGAVLILGETIVDMSGGVMGGGENNNDLELMAAVEALKAIQAPARIVIHTDSRYVERAIEDAVVRARATDHNATFASGNPVTRPDLWRDLVLLCAAHQVSATWVKGHSGDPVNERADRLAARGRWEQIRREDVLPASVLQRDSPARASTPHRSSARKRRSSRR